MLAAPLLARLDARARSAASWRAEADYDVIVKDPLAVMKKHGVGAELLAEIHEVVRRHIPPRERSARV